MLQDLGVLPSELVAEFVDQRSAPEEALVLPTVRQTRRSVIVRLVGDQLVPWRPLKRQQLRYQPACVHQLVRALIKRCV